jgi:hypothetical protein
MPPLQVGFLPVMLALVALAMASGVLYMPTGSAGASVLQVGLVERKKERTIASPGPRLPVLAVSLEDGLLEAGSPGVSLRCTR